MHKVYFNGISTKQQKFSIYNQIDQSYKNHYLANTMNHQYFIITLYHFQWHQQITFQVVASQIQKERVSAILQFCEIHIFHFIIVLIQKMSSDYLKKPMLAKRMESTICGGFTLTTCQMQGWRKTMEDASLFVELNEEVYLFGVFDGHGGPEIAHYVAQILPKQILNEPYFKLKNYPKALTNVFKRIEELLGSERGEEELKIINKRLNGSPIVNGQKLCYRAGTTALVLLMTKHSYFVANIGDSRAILSSANETIALSKDHKPELQTERERIEKAGGFVKQGRVNGTLSLSRSFGDFQYKHFSKMPYDQQVVVSVPDIVEIERRPQDQFIILGCDGVWQKYVNSSPKMVNHIQQLHSKLEGKSLMQKLFNDLVAKDLKDASGWDNMTAMLIEFM